VPPGTAPRFRPSPRKLGKELKRAERAGARVMVIVGRQDWQRGEIGVRDLASHQQQIARAGDAGAIVGKILRPAH
jgi:histidyl-tRNA synthetase